MHFEQPETREFWKCGKSRHCARQQLNLGAELDRCLENDFFYFCFICSACLQCIQEASLPYRLIRFDRWCRWGRDSSLPRQRVPHIRMRFSVQSQFWLRVTPRHTTVSIVLTSSDTSDWLCPSEEFPASDVTYFSFIFVALSISCDVISFRITV